MTLHPLLTVTPDALISTQEKVNTCGSPSLSLPGVMRLLPIQRAAWAVGSHALPKGWPLWELWGGVTPN